MKFFIIVSLIFMTNAARADLNSCRAEYSEKDPKNGFMGKDLTSVKLNPELDTKNMEIGIFKIKTEKVDSPIGEVFTIEVNHNDSQSFSAYPLDTKTPFTVVTDGNYRVRVICH